MLFSEMGLVFLNSVRFKMARLMSKFSCARSFRKWKSSSDALKGTAPNRDAKNHRSLHRQEPKKFPLRRIKKLERVMQLAASARPRLKEPLAARCQKVASSKNHPNFNFLQTIALKKKKTFYKLYLVHNRSNYI